LAKTAQKIKTNCIYRTLAPIVIGATGPWVGAGEIVDLSDSADECIRWLLEHGYIETADGEPVNTPTGVVERPPCPCGK